MDGVEGGSTSGNSSRGHSRRHSEEEILDGTGVDGLCALPFYGVSFGL